MQVKQTVEDKAGHLEVDVVLSEPGHVGVLAKGEEEALCENAGQRQWYEKGDENESSPI